MTVTELRYHFEHVQLPKYYFENTAPFLSELIEVDHACNCDAGLALFNIFADMARNHAVEIPYTAGDFEAEVYELSETNYMVRVGLPVPQKSPLCLYIYFLFTDDLSRKKFFTVELMGRKWRRNRYLLCEWRGKEHINYGRIFGNTGKIEREILRLYFEGSRNRSALIRART